MVGKGGKGASDDWADILRELSILKRCSHDNVLRRLRDAAGLQGPVLDLVQSYLTGRRQRSRLGSGVSGWRGLDAGTPQGGVWSPAPVSYTHLTLPTKA